MLNIIKGVERTPIKCVIYGAEGVGKTSLAAKMPDPLFIDTEGGTARLNVRRVKVSSWDELVSVVKEVISTPTICKTLVVDTADWAEALCTDYICSKYRQASIESFGFGKGYTYLGEEFGEFLKLLTKLVEVGINPVVIAHGKPRKYELPEEQGQFDRWEMKLSKQCAPLLKEWCDILLFCNYKTFVVTTENNSKKAQGGKRVMYTNHHPTFDAKNRFNLPEELDLNYKGIEHLFADSVKEAKKEVTPEIKASAIVTKLKELIKDNGIAEEDIEKIVVAKGHYQEGSHIADYDEDFITRWIIPNFNKIVETINKNNGGKTNE